MSKTHISRFSLLLICCLIALHSYAQTWDGGGANDNWSTGSNWVGDVAPGNPTPSILGFNGTLRLTPNVDTPWTVGGLNFLSGAGAFVIGGGNLTIGTGGITVNSAANQTLTNNILLSANQTWAANSGNLTVSGSLNLGTNSLSVTSATSRLVGITGGISGIGGLNKLGAGILRLSGTNSYSGNTVISAGQVQAAGDQVFGTGSLLFNGASTLNATGNRTFANQVRINTTGAVAFTGGNMTFTSNFVLNSNGFLNVASSRVILDGGLAQIGGSRNISKGGGGALIVNNSYSANGTVTITGGTLALGAGVAVPPGNLVLAGGMLSMNGTFTRSLGTGPGQVRWTNSGGFAAYGGNLTVNIPGNPVWGSTLNFLAANRQLRLSSSIADAVVTWESDFSLGGAGNRTINVINNPASAADWAVISGNISGAGNLVKLGAPLYLLGNNSFTGFLHVATGQVFVNTLENATVSSGAGAGSEIRLGQAGNTGNFVYMGTGHSSNRTWRLVGTRGGGQITAQGSGALILTGNARILAGFAKTLTLQGNSTALNTFSGQISNGAAALSVVKTGTGTWVLSGNNTHTGNTTLSAGTLLVGGNSTLGSGNFVLFGGTVGSHGGPRIIPNRTFLAANSQIAAGSNLTFSGNFTNAGANRILTVNSGAMAYFTGNVLLSESATNRILTFSGAGNSVVSGVISNGPSTASRLAKTGTGTLLLTNNNTYSGNTAVSGGILEIRAANALGNSSAPTIVSSGATLATNGTFTTNERLILAGAGFGSSGALRHLGGSVTVGGNVTLTAATTISSEAGGLTFSPAGGNAVGGNYALTLTGAGNMTLVQRYNLGSAPLVKNGSGRVVLQSTASPYTSGNVTLNNGTFEVNGLLGSGGGLLVQSGARLEGSGTIQKPTTISGTHAPGAFSGVGSQTFSSSLSYAASSTLEWQLLANTETGPGTNFDQVLVTGGNLTIASGSTISLIFNSSNSSVDWTNSFWDTSRQWTAISFSSSGSSTGNFSFVNLSVDSLGQSLTSARPGAVFQVSRVGNDIVVLYHLPEPSSVCLIVGSGLALYLLRRRRPESQRGFIQSQGFSLEENSAT